ncbi:hypothetical protein [Saccharothrix obliqua]|uniref:hypothetical protein n=1 Tax=Saccharothrix obliqua TaxID=2861747 RepID=UPI001C5F0C0E|nr:hypothetical protein [Saccharothrix obliqua]MBW4717352.1 hypothetical protein [Saccharothrix obliqua]
MTSIVADPSDAQQILYGTVTRQGVLVGSYYCADRLLQQDWRVITADAHHLTYRGRLPEIDHAGAVWLLTQLAAPWTG